MNREVAGFAYRRDVCPIPNPDRSGVVAPLTDEPLTITYSERALDLEKPCAAVLLFDEASRRRQPSTDNTNPPTSNCDRCLRKITIVPVPKIIL